MAVDPDAINMFQPQLDALKTQVASLDASLRALSTRVDNIAGGVDVVDAAFTEMNATLWPKLEGQTTPEQEAMLKAVTNFVTNY